MMSGIIGVMLGLLFAVPTLSDSLETEAKKIEEMLIAPCCWTQLVSKHPSGASEQIKHEIRQLLAAGKTRQEILDLYVEAYGERILARPSAHGFNLLAYLLPGVFLILGGWVVIVFIRNWQEAKPIKKNHTKRQRPITEPEIEKYYEIRLEEDLRKLD